MASVVANLLRDLELSPVVIVSAIAGLVFVWRFLLPSKLDPREPPEVHATIPFVGHLFGMLWHRAEYITILSRKVSLPIYTIRILGGRLYVIRSPELIQKTFANPKAFTFDIFISDALKRLMNLSHDEMQAFFQPGADGGPSYSHEIHALNQSILSPGASASQMNDFFQTRLVQSIREIGTEGKTVKLYRWTRDAVSLAACAGMFGLDNSYEDDSSLIDALWDFETDLNVLIICMFPSITARKGFRGRARLQKAYEEHFRSERWKNGSSLLKGRMAIAEKRGFTNAQTAEWEVMMSIAAITNAIPIAFWMLSYIIADSELARFVQDEVELVVSMKVVDGKKSAVIDSTLIRDHCPLLVSIWEELLRTISQPTLGRSVTTDIVLNNEYLLKKGSVVQIPTGIPQSDPSFWGQDAASWNANRFIKKSEKLTGEEREQRKLQNRAMSPFGGGRNLCPGRHIAFNETLSFVAMVVYAFEIENKDGTSFEVVEAAPKAFGASVPKAKRDVEVVIRLRKEFEGVKLAFAGGEQ